MEALRVILILDPFGVSLISYLFSVSLSRYRCGIAVVLLWYCCGIAVVLLWFRSILELLELFRASGSFPELLRAFRSLSDPQVVRLQDPSETIKFFIGKT